MSRRCSVLFLTLVPVLITRPSCAQSDAATQLGRITVFAGQYTTGEQPGAVLNSLDILRTPGAAADISRALQTFPGVQLPDECNALFVRGGDSFETITLVIGLRYPNPTRLNAPAGSFAGTLNPFQAGRINFTSGGFGAFWQRPLRHRGPRYCRSSASTLRNALTLRQLPAAGPPARRHRNHRQPGRLQAPARPRPLSRSHASLAPVMRA